MSSIATIISYCTNDYRFIDRCIEEAKVFSQEIVIPVCDHLFDGTPENRLLLENTYAKHPDCRFVEFRYLPDRLYSRYHTMGPEHEDWAIYWAATARYVGMHYVKPECDYILFLDCDEIAEGKRIAAWLDRGEYRQYEAMRLGAYLYTLRPTFRSTKFVNLSFLVKKETLAPLTLLNGLERIGAYLNHPGPKRQEVLGLDGEPMIHHYSWVRTREECARKTETWSHRNDADWPTLIEEAFSGKTRSPFRSPFEFEEMGEKPYFDPFTVPFPIEKLPLSNPVLKIDDRDLFRKEIEHALL